MSVNVESSTDTPEGFLFGRRKAVHGESFDPTIKEHDETEVEMVPKTTEQRHIIEENLKELFIFQHLDPDQFEGAVNALYERKVSPGENILNFGEEGRTFFIIQKGTFKSYIKDDGQEILQRCYVDRGHFGELYLLYGEPVDVRVTAASEGVLWCLDRKTYKRIILSIRAKKLAEFDQYVQAVPILSQLKPRERNEIVSAVEIHNLKPGDQIVEQGDKQKGMYIILKGTLKFQQKLNNGDISQWSDSTVGAVFGEKSLVSKCWWPYSICAESQCEIAYLSVEAAESSLSSLKL